jgi:hypothetical protein
MPFTKTFGVTTTQQDIVAHSFTRRVRLAEDASVGDPTSNFVIRRPAGIGGAIQRLIGTSYEINGNFSPGQVLGTIALAAGGAPTTFQQDEE